MTKVHNYYYELHNTYHLDKIIVFSILKIHPIIKMKQIYVLNLKNFCASIYNTKNI